MRRLPVYLLLDVSGSMRGEPIAAVNKGLQDLVDALRMNPYALETAFLSIITFNDQVENVVPLTELYKIQIPTLEAKRGTYLGKALKFLSSKAEEDVVKTTSERKGDWKPLTFIMSDGRSGDKIEKAMKEVNIKQFGCIVACGYGNNVNLEALRQITSNVVCMRETTGDSISSFFKWITASIVQTSTKLEETNSDSYTMNELPPPPSRINLIKM